MDRAERHPGRLRSMSAKPGDRVGSSARTARVGSYHRRSEHQRVDSLHRV